MPSRFASKATALAVVTALLMTRTAPTQGAPVQTPDARFIEFEGPIENLQSLGGDFSNRVAITVAGMEIRCDLNQISVSTATTPQLTKNQILDENPLPGNGALMANIDQVSLSTTTGAAASTVVSLASPHGLAAGTVFPITILGSNADVAINGAHLATALADDRQFSIPVANTAPVGGPLDSGAAIGVVELKPAIRGYMQGIASGVAQERFPGVFDAVTVEVGGLEQAFGGRISRNDFNPITGVTTLEVNNGAIKVGIPVGWPANDGDSRQVLQVTSNRALDMDVRTFQVGQVVGLCGAFGQDGLFHVFTMNSLGDIGAGGGNDPAGWAGRGPVPVDPVNGLNIGLAKFIFGALEGERDGLVIKGASAPGLIGRILRVDVQFEIGGPFLNQGVTIITPDAGSRSVGLGRFNFVRRGLGIGSPSVTANPNLYPKIARVTLLGSVPPVESVLHF